MKSQDALDIIHGKPKGYMVSFEWIEGIRSDHFPDKHAGEALIPTEREAWSLAERFARATKGKTCNFLVVDDSYQPVKGRE